MLARGRTIIPHVFFTRTFYHQGKSPLLLLRVYRYH